MTPPKAQHNASASWRLELGESKWNAAPSLTTHRTINVESDQRVHQRRVHQRRRDPRPKPYPQHGHAQVVYFVPGLQL